MSAIYTPAQVAQFLDFLQIPKEFYSGHQPILDLAFLTILHVRMITTVPFENLALHYASNRDINLSPDAIFDKIVAGGRGRGGYCMEGNLLMLYMLRALGFQVYPVGARVRARVDGKPTGQYSGMAHIVNIVTLPDSTRWITDVSFGGDGPTRPMPLREDVPPWRNLGAQEARLIRDFIPGQTELNPGDRLWLYQCRNGAAEQWLTFYAFSDKVEWLGADFEVASYWAATKSWQAEAVLVVKFLREGEEVGGKRMVVNGVVKENKGEKTVVVKECKSEEERVAALKELFGMELTVEEKDGIRGHVTELKG